MAHRFALCHLSRDGCSAESLSRVRARRQNGVRCGSDRGCASHHPAAHQAPTRPSSCGEGTLCSPPAGTCTPRPGCHLRPAVARQRRANARTMLSVGLRTSEPLKSWRPPLGRMMARGRTTKAVAPTLGTLDGARDTAAGRVNRRHEAGDDTRTHPHAFRCSELAPHQHRPQRPPAPTPTLA